MSYLNKFHSSPFFLSNIPQRREKFTKPPLASNYNLKGQSHGDFPIFFDTILINLYPITLFTHELLLYHQGGNIKWNFQNKNKPKLVFQDFIWDTKAVTWKILPDVFKSDAISILAIPIQTYFL